MPVYAALVVSPRALPDGLILVFQHPAKERNLFYHEGHEEHEGLRAKVFYHEGHEEHEGHEDFKEQKKLMITLCLLRAPW